MRAIPRHRLSIFAAAVAACMSTSAAADETTARKALALLKECYAPAGASPSESLAELFCYQYQMGTILLQAAPEHWQTDMWQRDYDEHWKQLVVLHGMLVNGAHRGTSDELWAEHTRRLIEAGSDTIWVPKE